MAREMLRQQNAENEIETPDLLQEMLQKQNAQKVKETLVIAKPTIDFCTLTAEIKSGKPLSSNLLAEIK